MHQKSIQPFRKMREQLEYELNQLQHLMLKSPMQASMIQWIESGLSIFQEPSIQKLFASKGPKKKRFDLLITELNDRLSFLFASFVEIKNELNQKTNEEQSEFLKWQNEKNEWQLKVAEWASVIGYDLPTLPRFRSLLPSQLDPSKCVLKPLTLEDGKLKLPYESQKKINDPMTITMDISSTKTYSEPIGNLTNGYAGNYFEIKQSNGSNATDQILRSFYGYFDSHSNLGAIIDGKSDTWFEMERYHLNEQQKIALPLDSSYYELPDGKKIDSFVYDDDFVLRAMMRIRLNQPQTINAIELEYMIPPFQDAKAPEIEFIQILDRGSEPHLISFAKTTDTKISFDPILASTVLIGFKQQNRYATKMGLFVSQQAIATKQAIRPAMIEKLAVVMKMIDRQLSIANDSNANEKVQYYYEAISNQNGLQMYSLGLWFASKFRFQGKWSLKTIQASRYVIGIKSISLLQNQYYSSGEWVTKPIRYQDPIQSIQLDAAFVDSKYEPYTTYDISVNDGITWYPIHPKNKQIGSIDEVDVPKLYLFTTSKQPMNTTLAFTKMIEVPEPIYQIRFRIRIILPENQLNMLQLFAENDQLMTRLTPSFSAPMLQTIHGNREISSILNTASLFFNDNNALPITNTTLPNEVIDDEEQGNFFNPLPIEAEPEESIVDPEKTPLEIDDDTVVDPDFTLPEEPIEEPIFNVSWNAQSMSKCIQDQWSITASVEASDGVDLIQWYVNGVLAQSKNGNGETLVESTLQITGSDFDAGENVVIRLFVLNQEMKDQSKELYVTAMNCAPPKKTYEIIIDAPGNCEAYEIGTMIDDANPIVFAKAIRSNGQEFVLTILDSVKGIVDLPCEIEKNEKITILYEREPDDTPIDQPVRSCLEFSYVELWIYNPITSQFEIEEIAKNELPATVSNQAGTTWNITWSNTLNALIFDVQAMNQNGKIGKVTLHYVDDYDLGKNNLPKTASHALAVNGIEKLTQGILDPTIDDCAEFTKHYSYLALQFESMFQNYHCAFSTDWELPSYTSPMIALEPLPTTSTFGEYITIKGTASDPIGIRSIAFDAMGSTNRMIGNVSFENTIESFLENEIFEMAKTSYAFEYQFQITNDFLAGDRIQIRATATNDVDLIGLSNAIETTIEERIPDLIYTGAAQSCFDQQSTLTFQAKAIASKPNTGQLERFILFGNDQEILFETTCTGSSQTIQAVLNVSAIKSGSNSLRAIVYNTDGRSKSITFSVTGIQCIPTPLPELTAIATYDCPLTAVAVETELKNWNVNISKIEVVDLNEGTVYETYVSPGSERYKFMTFYVEKENITNLSNTNRLWSVKGYGVINGIEQMIDEQNISFNITSSCLTVAAPNPIVEAQPVDSDETWGVAFEWGPKIDQPQYGSDLDLAILIYDENCNFVKMILTDDITSYPNLMPKTNDEIAMSGWESVFDEYRYWDINQYKIGYLKSWKYYFNEHDYIKVSQPKSGQLGNSQYDRSNYFYNYTEETLSSNTISLFDINDSRGTLKIKGMKKYHFFVGFINKNNYDNQTIGLGPKMKIYKNTNGWMEGENWSFVTQYGRENYARYYYDSEAYGSGVTVTGQISFLYHLKPYQGNFIAETMSANYYIPREQPNSTELVSFCSGKIDSSRTKTNDGTFTLSTYQETEYTNLSSFVLTYHLAETFTNGMVQFQLPYSLKANANTKYQIGSNAVQLVPGASIYQDGRLIVLSGINQISQTTIKIIFESIQMPIAGRYFYEVFADADGFGTTKLSNDGIQKELVINPLAAITNPPANYLTSKPTIVPVPISKFICVDQNESVRIQATIEDPYLITDIRLTWSIVNSTLETILSPGQFSNLHTARFDYDVSIPLGSLSSYVGLTISFNLQAKNGLNNWSDPLPSETFKVILGNCNSNDPQAYNGVTQFTDESELNRTLPSTDQNDPTKPFTPTTPYLIVYDRPFQTNDQIQLVAEFGNIPSAYPYAKLWKKNEIDNVYWSYNNTVNFSSNLNPTEIDDLDYYDQFGYWLVPFLVLNDSTRKQKINHFTASFMDLNYTMKVAFYERLNQRLPSLVITQAFETPFTKPPGQTSEGSNVNIVTYDAMSKSLVIKYFMPTDLIAKGNLVIKKNGTYKYIALENNWAFSVTETSTTGGKNIFVTSKSGDIKNEFDPTHVGFVSLQLFDIRNNKHHPGIKKRIVF